MRPCFDRDTQPSPAGTWPPWLGADGCEDEVATAVEEGEAVEKAVLELVA
jgi:hypothetical protein